MAKGGGNSGGSYNPNCNNGGKKGNRNPRFNKKSEETKGKMEKREAQKLTEARKILWEALLKK